MVNDFTLDEQGRPSVAGHGTGGFLVSWESNLQDASSLGVFARRLSNAGTAIGAEFQVHTYTSSFQSAPAAAAGAEGKLVVVWHSYHDGSSTGVFAQRLAAPATLDVDGSLSVERADRWAPAAALPLRLPRRHAGLRGGRSVDCMRCDAAAIEAYLASPPVAAQGPGQATRQGAEFQVNSYTPNYQFEQSVAADADGDFVVSWVSTVPGRLVLRHLRPTLLERGNRARRRVPDLELHAGQPVPASRWRRRPTATSSSPGRASARMAPTTESSPAASRARALASPPSCRSTPTPRAARVTQRSAPTATATSSWPGTRSARTARGGRHLRPPVLQQRIPARPPSSRSTPIPRALSGPGAGDRRRRRLRRGVG